MAESQRSIGFAALLVLVTPSCGGPVPSIAPEVLEAMEGIRPEAIEEHMRRLSDDGALVTIVRRTLRAA